MPYRYDPPPATVVEALLLLKAEDLKALMNTLPVPKPRPTRTADMAEAVAGYLHGSSLRRIWETLGERHVVVRSNDEKSFRKAVHGLGYGMPRT